MTDRVHEPAGPEPPGGAGAHVPVLLDEVLAGLDPRAGDTALDCTAGRGGHAAAIAERLGTEGRLVLIDADADNAAHAASRAGAVAGAPEVTPIHANFADAPRRAVELGVAADVVLADLGFSSSQMEDPSRGMSFSRDGPLDMRFDRASGLTAADAVNTWAEADLAEVIRDFGEDPAARRIARAIVAARASAPIETTGRLAEIVRRAAGRPRRSRTGPGLDAATRTFQALRIAVNDELGSLASLLEGVARAAATLASGGGAAVWLAPGARIGVISFHSLEDRAVKRSFAELSRRGLAETIGPRPTVAGEAEVARNPRARSAKLRVIRITARRGAARSID